MLIETVLAMVLVIIAAFIRSYKRLKNVKVHRQSSRIDLRKALLAENYFLI